MGDDNLERIIGDSNIVPMHLRGKGVDIGLIEELIDTPKNRERLLQQMNLKTYKVFCQTLKWYEDVKRREGYALERLEIYLQLEQCERDKKELFPNGVFGEIFDAIKGIPRAVNDSYTPYLTEKGVPPEKINTLRKALLLYDIIIANTFKREVDNVEPSGFGPYAIIGYPLRTITRYFMLRGSRG